MFALMTIIVQIGAIVLINTVGVNAARKTVGAELVRGARVFDRLKEQDTERLVQGARLPLRTLKLGGMWGTQDWPRWMHAVTDDDALLPQVPSPEDVMVIVAGGPGKHSAVVPNCTFSRAVTRPIQAL